MAKSERLVKTVKNNFGTYAKIQENLSQMGGDEFVYITDRLIPLAPTTDGDYMLRISSGAATWVNLPVYNGGVVDVNNS